MIIKKIILSTEDMFYAQSLKNDIIKSVKEDSPEIIDNWNYAKANGNIDVIFHNPDQYVNDKNKNVLFKVERDDNNVVLTNARWQNNPEPSFEMISLHIGRLVEMLLSHFSNQFSRLTILDLQ